MRNGVLWLAAVALVASSGCQMCCQGSKSEKGATTPAETTGKAAVESRDNVLKTLRASVESLEKRVNEAVASAGDRAAEVRKSLEPRLQNAKDELKKAGSATEEAWDKTRTLVEQAIKDVEGALKESKPQPKP